MSMLTDLRARLVADAGVNAITTRIRLVRSEQSDTLPRIVIHQINGNHEHHMTAATGVVNGRVQIDCHATSPVGSLALAEAVRQSLDGFQGSMGSTFVMTCHLDDERPQYTPPIEGGHPEAGVDAVQLDYIIGWQVTIPTF